MAIDEFYFHHRRKLPAWERRGHPMDTFFYLLALTWMWLAGSGAWTAGLAVFSTLLITKDEFIHGKLCSPGEHWLHSVLFILHPVCLYLAFASAGTWSPGILVILVLFLFFQIFYWNFYAYRSRQIR